MSTMKKIEVKFESGKKYKVSLERYSSANELVDDCSNRKADKGYPDMKKDKELEKSWHGVNSYDEAMDLLRCGYQPTVEKLQTALKMTKQGSGKRIKFENNVHGFAPVVPLALKGVPNSMVNMTMKPIKCKVVDVYYDMGVPSFMSSEEIIECGQKLLSAIIELEKQGYRFNLYALQAFSGSDDADILCVKVKSSDKPLDIKRISFPLTHSAFFRVIGFDWQGKSPATRYRGSGRGQALTQNISVKESKEFGKQVFGDNAIYISCNSIRNDDVKHIKEVMVG